ncbi:hypothetical protein AAMO2058_000688900 [Amorphochlora amoebiformis]
MAAMGYIGVLMAVVCFGSNFAVVKKFDGGDGIFFQLMMCMGIWTAGLVVHLVLGSPKFYPIAMIGGACWAIGNSLCVYIIKNIGMALGLVIWGSTAMLVGWCTGFFGLFGLEKDEIARVWLNILGLCLALTSIGISFFIKPSVSEQPKVSVQIEDGEIFVSLPNEDPIEEGKISPGHVLSSVQEKPIVTNHKTNPCMGMVAAVVAGLLFGNNFDPPTYIQQHNCQGDNRCVERFRGASSDPLNYVFSHFCGIYAMSMLIFFGYTIYKKNKPWISSELTFPAFLSGVIWAIGQIGWFIANGELGYTVAFPMVVIGPGIVGSIWSIFLFKSIRGFNNYLLLLGVFSLSISCCVCMVLSKSSG